MTHIDKALAELRKLDEAASPGPWSTAVDPNTGWLWAGQAPIFVRHRNIPESAQVAANARLASLAKGHLLRALEASAAEESAYIQTEDFGQITALRRLAAEKRREFLAALADAILGEEKS